MGFIDIALLAIFGIVTWCVASEGAWGAVLVALCTLFAGLLAMNFFEPMAGYLETTISNAPAWSKWWDMLSLVGLFALFVFLLRLSSERLLPIFVPVHPVVHEAGRWTGAVMTGYITMAFLLTSLHTAPLPREFLGFRPERRNLMGIAAPDRHWLGFMQFVSEKSLRRRYANRVFDGPQFSVGEYKDMIWPSFPIRYASRRERGSIAAASSTEGGGLQPIRKSGTAKPAPPTGAIPSRSDDDDDDCPKGRRNF